MDLPEDIVADILSRISIKTLCQCRCVCKRWRGILSEPYFVNLHQSRTPAGLIIHNYNGDIVKLCEEDDIFDQHDTYHDPLKIINLGIEPLLFRRYMDIWLSGSVNGLICLCHRSNADATYICNPITREYILLPDHKHVRINHNIRNPYVYISYGFRFVEATNQYKVIRIYQSKFPYTRGSYKTACEIYTLRRGMWICLPNVPFDVYHVLSEHVIDQPGIFVCGNLHWLAYDVNDINNQMICTFDLEKELFQPAVAAPRVGGNVNYKRTLGMLRGCLCLCDNTQNSEITIWLMKDYGRNTNWSKEIVFTRDKSTCTLCDSVRALKVLKDETILMLSRNDFLFTYPGNKTLQKVDCFESFDAMVYAPSFITLKSFLWEKVSVF